MAESVEDNILGGKTIASNSVNPFAQTVAADDSCKTVHSDSNNAGKTPSAGAGNQADFSGKTIPDSYSGETNPKEAAVHAEPLKPIAGVSHDVTITNPNIAGVAATAAIIPCVKPENTALEPGMESRYMSEEEITGKKISPDELQNATTRYKVVRQIGEGGLGVVLLAYDNRLRRNTVLKLMKPGFSNEFVERFLLEAMVTARLQHPNIVPVSDIGKINYEGKEQAFYSMKFIEGESLESVINKILTGDTKIAEEYSTMRLLTVFQQVCNALSYAHSSNIVHRDLKPANIMIGEFGEVLVVDWGLAKFLGEKEETTTYKPIKADTSTKVWTEDLNQGLTMQGTIIGTPQYLSPEQAEGKINEMDNRSDIFSLGAILYTILTHQQPFTGKTIKEIVDKVIKETPALPSSMQKGIDQQLDDIVMKALSKNPKQRHQTVRQLHDEIQMYLDGRRAELDKARATQLRDDYSNEEALVIYERSISLLEQAIEEGRKSGVDTIADVCKLVDCLFKKAALLYRLQQNEETLQCYRRACEILKEPKRQLAILELKATANNGLLSGIIGDDGQEWEMYKEALALGCALLDAAPDSEVKRFVASIHYNRARYLLKWVNFTMT